MKRTRQDGSQMLNKPGAWVTGHSEQGMCKCALLIAQWFLYVIIRHFLWWARCHGSTHAVPYLRLWNATFPYADLKFMCYAMCWCVMKKKTTIGLTLNPCGTVACRARPGLPLFWAGSECSVVRELRRTRLPGILLCYRAGSNRTGSTECKTKHNGADPGIVWIYPIVAGEESSSDQC